MKSVITALALLAGASASAAELPSVEHFMRHATYSSARISPTGEYLALGVDRGGQDVLTVIRLKDMKLLKVNVLPDEKSVAGYQWIGDDRLIFTAIRKYGSFAQPFGTGEWYAVNADGSQPRPVIFRGSRGTAERAKAVFNENFSMVDPLENDPRNVLMSATTPRSRTGSNTELVMVDTVSGVRKTLATAPRENCSLAVDEKKQPRFALCFDQENEEGEYDTRTELYRLGDDGKWALVNNADIGDGKQIRVAWTAKDGTIYALQDDGKKPAAFGTLDRQTGNFQKIFQDEVSDISRYVGITCRQ